MYDDRQAFLLLKRKYTPAADLCHIYARDAITVSTFRRVRDMVLSIKVGLANLPRNMGVLKEGSGGAQAIAGAPVTARRVAKRAALVSR